MMSNSVVVARETSLRTAPFVFLLLPITPYFIHQHDAMEYLEKTTLLHGVDSVPSFLM